MSTLDIMYGEVPGQIRAPDDLYIEPVSATTALLAVEQLHGNIWDPACGTGNVLRACRERDYRLLWGSDIRPPRPPAYCSSFTADFLQPIDRGDWRPGSIICNPPYKHANAFALQALRLAQHKVALFLRLQWLEGASRYESIFEPYPPSRIWVFRRRVGMTKFGVKHASGMMPHMWVVWSDLNIPRAGRVEPVLGWI